MAKSIKTDLFAGIMNEPEQKAVSAGAKKNSGKNNNTSNKKYSKKSETIEEENAIEVVTEEKDISLEEENIPADITSTEVNLNSTKSIDDFLMKKKKIRGGSHTFYLKDSVYKKLEDGAKARGISPSKLLEAMIEMTLDES